jgi:hypothetical protein
MSKKMKNKEPLYFVSYHIDCDREQYRLLPQFSTRWVRLLNINQEELCETLKYIEGYKHLKNTDGTLVVGDELTILPSETMEMEMDVIEENVSIKNNLLYCNNPKTDEEKVLTIKDYLYGGDNYIMSCWEYSKTKECREDKKKEYWKEMN